MGNCSDLHNTQIWYCHARWDSSSRLGCSVGRVVIRQATLLAYKGMSHLWEFLYQLYCLILLKQQWLSGAMKTLRKWLHPFAVPIWTPVMYMCLFVLNLCSLTAPVTGFFPMCSNLHATFCSELMLRPGLMHTCPISPLATGNSKSSHIGGDRNTSLSPWWRNLCLSTVFYSVCSDRWCN